ncbi:monocarboxylate transporter [Plakobranchus ocellatus]|uniref:Monocarboxylate transporter n=1 Tax=Plakobranchus ocellatus TaxID=259542 RepID=A0AAV4CJA8_9GAST|nr:monocarboxylate transporter [Plakobranchus ocellatus]
MIAPESEGSSKSDMRALSDKQGSSQEPAASETPTENKTSDSTGPEGGGDDRQTDLLMPPVQVYGKKNGSVNIDLNAAEKGGGGEEGEGRGKGDEEFTEQWQAPDGGWGWVVVFSALIISLIVDGLTYTFGLFLGQFERAFSASKSTVALASSLQVGIYLMIGPVVSALTNRFGCRPVIICGSLIAAFAYMVSSASDNVIVLILTYGFLGGVGFGLMYLPSIVSVSVYFEEKRALATGIAVCGSGIGMFLLAPLTEFLLDLFNWRWTLVLLGGIILNGMVFGGLIRPLGTENAKGKSGPQMIGSADENDIADRFGSHRSRHGSVGSPIFIGDSRKDSHRHRTVSVASGSSGKELNTESGIALVPLIEGVESITVEVLEEPVSKKSSRARNNSQNDERSKHLLLPPSAKESAANFSSSPAIHNLSTKTHVRQRSSSGTDHHMSKAVSSAHELFQRIQSTASHQTLDPEAKQLRARTPLGLSVVSLSASSAHLSQEIYRSRHRANSTDKQSAAEKVKTSCLDCLSPATRSIILEMLNFSILKNQKYWFVLMGNFFCMIGFYVPFVYIPERAIELGIDEAKAAFLLSVIGISNTVGRVLIGLIVQCLRLDCVLVTTVALIVSGGVTVLLPLTQDYAVLAALSAVFGLCVAAYIALCSVLLCDLLGVQNLTNAFGYVILFRGVACIIGPPLAGAIIDSTGVFDPAFFLGGGMIVLGGVCHLLLYLLYFTPCRKS